MPKSTKYTIEQVKEKIKDLYPSFEGAVKKEDNGHYQVKCNKCGKIHDFSRLNAIWTRVNICKCTCDFRNIQEKVHYLLNKYNFELLKWKSSGEKIMIKCKNCGFIMNRFPNEILRNPSYCSECNNSVTKPLSKNNVQLKIDNAFGENEYELLDYTEWRNKSHIKHLKCNTIFTQQIGHFLEGCGCPKCFRKRSKGENKIEAWLKNNNINFISQKFFTYKNKRFYFDFLLTDYNIAIEYNGEQHYNKDNYFNKKDSENYNRQQRRDADKKKYCEENKILLIVIPYWDLNNIEHILDIKLNDYRKY